MGEIRGEKVSFGKQDIVALHSLPSAQAHDPCIVHSPRRRGIMHLCARGIAIIAGSCVLLLLLAVLAIEGGVLDGPLNNRAQSALNAAVGDGYHAEVGSTVLRLTSDGGLALKAQDVTLVEDDSDQRLITTNSVFIELDPFALIRGRVAVSRLEAEGATLDPTLLPQGKPIDLATIRIAGLGNGLEFLFKQMDGISDLIARSNTQTVRLADLRLSFDGPRKKVVPVVIDSIEFTRGADGSMQIDGAFSIDGETSGLHLRTERQDGRIARMTGDLQTLPLAPFMHREDNGTEDAFGLRSHATVNVSATRGADGVTPTLRLAGKTMAGTFDAGGMSSELKPSELNVVYDFDRNRIEVLPSTLRVANSEFPFTGAVADLDPSTGETGFSLDLLLQSGKSAPVDVTEAPLVFDAKARGKFLSDRHQLQFDELTVSSALGSAAGSLAMTFGDVSPQISFALLTDRLQSAAVKQLWPWWVGRAARRWVTANIYGGTVTNGRLEIFLPMGRLTNTVGPVDLTGDEIKVGFDIADARVNITGDIPPLRDADGRFTLRGEKLDVAIAKGTAFFPSGRAVSVTGGDFAIPNVHEKPLMAEMKLDLAGPADAIAELVSYRPLEALQKTPFAITDFSGPMTAQVGARFGLIRDQYPPQPQWQTQMVLDGVTLNKPMAGRAISDIHGTLRIDPQQALLDATADIDGQPMKVALTEPVGSQSPVKRSREISGTLDSDAIAKVAPGLSDIIGGNVDVSITVDDNDKQTVSADLGDATLSLPWIGWSKGSGIGAKATFSLQSQDNMTRIDGLQLTGDGFGAKGSLVLDKAGLSSGEFPSIRLAQGDNYAVHIARQRSGFAVDVNGSAADVRPIIDRMRNSGSGSSGSGSQDSTRVAVSASLTRAAGFHSEGLSNVRLAYAGRGSNIDALDLSAVTDSGQAVVAKLNKQGADNIIELTAGDAGALARFANIYSNMRGGLMNVKLRDRGANSWRGSIDLRKFELIDEKRLQSMVSTPTGADGRSLNQAVKKDIDVSTARFERGYANVAIDSGMLAVENGVVRGTDIGATFQGMVRDSNGNMDMTGTFMPAYGLNRLFGELPLIGALLGNGRDRGLLGITFKLTGSFTKPNLTINPLSIIAPGVFRNIFEFQ